MNAIHRVSRVTLGAAAVLAGMIMAVPVASQTFSGYFRIVAQHSGKVLNVELASTAVGQRLESFAVDAWNASAWQQITSGTTVGYKRLLKINPVQTDRVRVRILQSRAAPSLANFGLFLEENSAAGVVLFQHSLFGGTASQPLAAGDYTLAQLQSLGLANDTASSATIPAGMTVTMFEHDNFTGISWTLTADTPRFSLLTPSANDRMSSCRVR